MTPEKYAEINYLMKEIADDLDMPVDVFKRVYVGSGEDFDASVYQSHIEVKSATMSR